jgi:hypothetical protein
MSDNEALLSLLDEDNRVIKYRPRFAEMLGSVTAGILLQQIIYWSGKQKHKPFYKYRDVCSAKDYKPGESWIEELAFRPREFDNALKVIGTKVKKGDEKKPLLDYTDFPTRNEGESDKDYLARVDDALSHLVIYWTDSNRKTYYLLNRELLGNCVRRNYLDDSVSRKNLQITVNASTLKIRKPKKSINSRLPETTRDKEQQKSKTAELRVIEKNAPDGAVRHEGDTSLEATNDALPYGDGHGQQNEWLNDETGNAVNVADPTQEEVQQDIDKANKAALRGEVFTVVARDFFGLPDTSKLDKGTKGRIGKVVSKLMELDPVISVDELAQFKAYYQHTYKNAAMPLSADKVMTHIQKFRHETAQRKQAAATQRKQQQDDMPPTIEELMGQAG